MYQTQFYGHGQCQKVWSLAKKAWFLITIPLGKGHCVPKVHSLVGVMNSIHEKDFNLNFLFSFLQKKIIACYGRLYVEDKGTKIVVDIKL